MSEDALVKIILALISLIGTIITVVLVPYIRTKTTKEQREEAEYWTNVAVEAIEDYYKLKGETGKGVLKKEYVMEFVIKSGIKISEDKLSLLIDKLVKEMNDAKEKLLE